MLLFSTTAGFYVGAFLSFSFFLLLFLLLPPLSYLYTLFCCCDPIDSTRLFLMIGEEEDEGEGRREGGREGAEIGDTCIEKTSNEHRGRGMGVRGEGGKDGHRGERRQGRHLFLF